MNGEAEKQVDWQAVARKQTERINNLTEELLTAQQFINMGGIQREFTAFKVAKRMEEGNETKPI